MATVYLFNFNNYYNRTAKVRPYTAGATSIYDLYYNEIYSNNFVGSYSGINFYINDHVTAKLEGFLLDDDMEPDYAILTDEDDRVLHTWFIIENVKQRGGQCTLHLRRDLINDFYDIVKNAPMFIEKGIASDTDPAIFNNENMSFNQIKTKEILLKDKSPCPWIVGYYAKNTTFDSPIAVEYNNGNVTTLNIGTPIQSWEYNVQSKQGTPSNEVYRISFGYGLGGNTRKTDISVKTGKDVGSKDYQGATTLQYTIKPTAAQFNNAFASFGLTKLDPKPYGDYMTEAQLSAMLEYEGKLVKDSNGEVYLIHFATTESKEYVKPINAGQLYNQLEYIVQHMPTYKSGPGPNSFELAYKTVKYTLEATRLTNYEANYTFASNRVKCQDAPYDLFAIPYGNVEVRSQTYGEFTMTKEVCMGAVNAFINRFNGTGLYDVQLLPYCPIPALNDGTGEIYVDSLTRDIQYTAIRAEDTQDIGYIFHVPYSRFSFNITDIKLRVKNTKIENETKLYRLCSPNFNGQFEFSPAKNGGVQYFSVDCEYKPFQPYIHINPNFKGLYGEDFNDARGLICGGDFSLSTVNNAWEQYQIQNKNYQTIFDRQLQSLDLQNKYGLRNDIGATVGGTIGGASSGAMMGAVAGGGPIGAAVGAVAGGIASLGTGAADIIANQALRKDARDLTVDQFGAQLRNIQALPYNLTKVSAINPNNKVYPLLEIYEATETERVALANKIAYNGMTIMRIGTIEEFETNFWSYNSIVAKNYIKGQLIQLPDINGDNHIVAEIAKELYQGLYFNP